MKMFTIDDLNQKPYILVKCMNFHENVHALLRECLHFHEPNETCDFHAKSWKCAHFIAFSRKCIKC